MYFGNVNNCGYLMYNWIKHFYEAIIISDKHPRNWPAIDHEPLRD
jgi:hypothetical protein